MNIKNFGNMDNDTNSHANNDITSEWLTNLDDDFPQLVSCDDCHREWDGNAQCPCNLVPSETSSESSDDDLFADINESQNESQNESHKTTIINENENENDIKGWSPLHSFEEGTPIENYINQQEEDIPPDMKYKNCMDAWAEKERERYKSSPKCRKILFNDDDYRIDPYDYQYYTRQEFYEYYGSDEVWKQQDPKKCLLRDHLHEILETYSHLEPKILNIFMKNIANTYS